MTIHRLVANPASAQPAVPFPAFPVHTMRLWDVVNWSMIEPVQGQFNWTAMDQTIAIAKENGVQDFIFTFGYVPAWASSHPSDSCGGQVAAGSCDAPDESAFDDFVTHVVQRYCGVVQYYETWNEPDQPIFWSGSNAQLATLASDLHRIASDPANCSAQNPNRILLPPISSLNQANLAWLDAYLSSTGSTYPNADVAAFHGYGNTQPENIVAAIPNFQGVLANHGLASLQLWDTEASWGTSVSDDQRSQASWAIRFHVTQAISGVSRFTWYAYDNCAWGTLWGPACGSAPDNWQGARLPAQAYAAAQSWLTGSTLTLCEQYEDGLWACALQRPGGYQGWILWNATNGASSSVAIPAQHQLTQYRDWQNVVHTLPQQLTVDEMPVLLENQSAAN